MTWEGFFFPPVISIILWFRDIFPSCVSFRSCTGTVLEQTSSGGGSKPATLRAIYYKSLARNLIILLKWRNASWIFSSCLIVCIFFLQFPLGSCSKTSCPNDNCIPKLFNANLCMFLCQYCPFTWLHFFSTPFITLKFIWMPSQPPSA